MEVLVIPHHAIRLFSSNGCANTSWTSSFHRMRKSKSAIIEWGIRSQNYLDVVPYHLIATSGHSGTDTETCRELAHILENVEFSNARMRETPCVHARGNLVIVSWIASTETKGLSVRNRSHVQIGSSNLRIKSCTAFTVHRHRRSSWFLRTQCPWRIFLFR